MKKKIFPIFACLVAIVMAFAIGVGIVPQAYADTATDGSIVITEDTILNKDEYFEDAALWAALVRIVERDFGGDGATVRAGDLKTATTLDLSDSNISSLDGLEFLIFSTSLKTLKLNNNSITEITESHIDKMLGLENIDVSNNRLTTFEVPSTLSLKTLNARNNSLSTINLSGMKKIDDVTPAQADLRVNDFVSVADISLPRSQDNKIDLQLAQNYLTDAVASDFAGHNVSLQLQGIHAGATQTKSNIYVRITPDVEGGEYEDLTAKVYYRRGSINFKDTVNIDDNLAAESDATGKLILPAGKMFVRYFSNGVELEGNITDGDIYFSHEIDVYPNAPTLAVFVDNKQIEYTEGEGIAQEFQVVAATKLDGAKIYITIDGEDYQEGDMVTIQKRGTYSISAYITYDGLKSSVSALIVKNSNSTGIVWGLIVFIALVVVIAATLFAIRWFRNGAVVAPLTDREIRTIQNNNKNRQNRK